jgi:uncharacterized protein
MQYLQSAKLEKQEEFILTELFEKTYLPRGAVSINRDTDIALNDVKFPVIDDKILAIKANTASWAFLTREEMTLARELFTNTTTYGRAADNCSKDIVKELPVFIKHLFRRGLLKLNGISSIDDTIFRDSANVEEGNLVELLLTEKCNLNCGYCLAGTSPHMPSMDEKIAYTTIDKAFAMPGASNITFEFSGGEPFMKFELFQSLTYYIRNHPGAKGKEIYICAQTNATLLNEPKVKWLKENDISVGVSVDGDPESHNLSRPTVTGAESFSKVIRGIHLLQKYEIDFGILVVLNSSNIASPGALISFLEKYGLRSLKLNPIAFLGTAQSNWDRFGLSNEQTLNYFKKFAGLLVNGNHAIYEDNLRTMIQYTMSKQRDNRCMRTHCGAGENFQAINSKGDIYPCGRSTQSPGLKIGNVLDDAVSSLSEAGLKNDFVQQIKNRRPNDFDDCRSCHYQQLCQAGCSAQAYEKYGTVLNKTPECHFYKNMYPYLMKWLTFDEKAFYHFNSIGYFEGGAKIYSRQYFV